MFDDNCESFREDIRAALVAAKQPVDLRLNEMRRLLKWLQITDLEKPSLAEMSDDGWGTEDDEGQDEVVAAGIGAIEGA